MRQPFATRCVKKEDVDQLQTEGVLPMTQSSSSGFIAVALASAILALPIALQAQSFSEAAMHAQRMARRAEMRAGWDSMSETERDAFRAERQARHQERRVAWDALSDEEKQARREAMRAHREERRAMWESMSPEERAAMSERRGNHHRKRQDEQ
jgi:hypothetical protein